MSLKIFHDALKWFQGFFVLVQERPRAAKTWQIEPPVRNINSTFFCSIFCMVTICKLYFNFNIVLHLDIVNEYIFLCLKMGPGFLKTGPGWSNATKSTNLNCP